MKILSVFSSDFLSDTKIDCYRVSDLSLQVYAIAGFLWLLVVRSGWRTCAQFVNILQKCSSSETVNIGVNDCRLRAQQGCLNDHPSLTFDFFLYVKVELKSFTIYMEKHDFLSQVIHSFDDKNLYSVIKVTKAIHRNQTFVHQKLYFLTLGKYRCVKSEIFINSSVPATFFR